MAAGNVTTDASVNPDAYADIVAATGPGVEGKVSLIQGGTFAQLGSFKPYGSTFKGGVFVAVGDYNGDFYADILTGPGVDLKQPASQLLVLSGKKISETAPIFSLDPIPPAWNLLAVDAFFKTTPTGLQSSKWIKAQGVSSVAFTKDKSGETTIVAGSPRSYGTQLMLYKKADNAFENYFNYFPNPGVAANILRYRDGIALAS